MEGAPAAAQKRTLATLVSKCGKSIIKRMTLCQVLFCIAISQSVQAVIIKMKGRNSAVALILNETVTMGLTLRFS